jgi:ATP-dependent exoDNAse (exonuclease V) alpha subunit
VTTAAPIASSAPPVPALLPREGEVVRVIFENIETGFRVLKVQVDGSKPEADAEAWVGSFPAAAQGMRVRATGTLENDARRGPQFKVATLETLVPTSLDGITAYLGSGLIHGIGPDLARKIVKVFGATTLTVLDTDPSALKRVKGIGEKKLESIAAAWKEQRVIAEVMAFLAQHGASPGLAHKILTEYGNEKAMSVVRDSPYRLAVDIDGVGFKTADRMALASGLPADSAERAQAAVIHALGEQFTSKGHVYARAADLVKGTAEMLERDPAAIGEAVVELHRAGKVMVERLDGELGDVVYPRYLHRAEVRLADRLRTLLGTPAGKPPKVPGGAKVSMTGCAKEAVKVFEAKAKVTLADAQREAVMLAATSKVMVMTGGPGVGKCLGRGTPVLMFDGSVRPVEEVQDGDLVMGPDSKPRRVAGTTSGRGPLYEIQPIKGTPWVCNDAHILTIVRSGTDEIRDMPLSEYIALGPCAKWRVKGKLFKVPVDFEEQPVAVDPYIVGVWLGDGARGAARVTTAEPEVVEALATCATACGMHLRFDAGRGCQDVSMTRGLIGPKPNSLLTEFRTLVTDRGEKHIPARYKVNSSEKRLALLAGLVDTDGFVEHKCIEITTKWRLLADDIAFLARSLGICVTITEKQVRLLGWDAPRTYYRLVLSGHLDQIPSRVPRRMVPPREQIKDALRTGFDAVPIGDGDYFGFTIDGDGRFLLGDFTVTHNTACTKAILTMLEIARLNVLCAAPTGRAARRMHEATGHEATTIHSMLEYSPQSRGYDRNRNRPLDCDAVIVDEASMVDLSLADALLQAIPDYARFIIIGDVDQLPSVGPGAVLRDVIGSGEVPVVRLTQVFRQAAGSLISLNAQRINAGETPESAEGPSGEFYVIERDDPASAADTILEMVTKRIPARFGFDPMEDMLVLSPMHKGDAGTIALNQRLQAELNPPAEGKAELKRGGYVLRVGDKVSQKKNDRERDISNGDVGVVLEINAEDRRVVVDFDGRKVTCEGPKQIEQLQLAYASSIHRVQGSEAPVVVVTMLTAHYMMLQRNLLYTAVSRSKRLCVLVTNKRALKLALAESRREDRSTLLARRLRGEVRTEAIP